MRPPRRLTGITLSAILIAGALLSCTNGGASRKAGPAKCHPTRILAPGDRIPDCSFRRFDGSVLKLTSLQGKPAVLNFWASWCRECVQEMPAFQQISQEFKGKVLVIGFNLLGVSGETESDARRFSKSRGVTYPLVFDQGGLLYSSFSFRTALPTTVLVNPAGVVAYRQFGELDAPTLRRLFDQYLKV